MFCIGLHMATFSSTTLRWLFTLSGLGGILDGRERPGVVVGEARAGAGRWATRRSGTGWSKY